MSFAELEGLRPANAKLLAVGSLEAVAGLLDKMASFGFAPFAELEGLRPANAKLLAVGSLGAVTGWLRLGLPPSQSSGGSIGGQQNCLLSEFPMSLYYSHGVALLGWSTDRPRKQKAHSYEWAF
jgi:hypothetical protein